MILAMKKHTKSTKYFIIVAFALLVLSWMDIFLFGFCKNYVRLIVKGYGIFLDKKKQFFSTLGQLKVSNVFPPLCACAKPGWNLESYRLRSFGEEYGTI